MSATVDPPLIRLKKTPPESVELTGRRSGYEYWQTECRQSTSTSARPRTAIRPAGGGRPSPHRRRRLQFPGGGAVRRRVPVAAAGVALPFTGRWISPRRGRAHLQPSRGASRPGRVAGYIRDVHVSESPARARRQRPLSPCFCCALWPRRSTAVVASCRSGNRYLVHSAETQIPALKRCAPLALLSIPPLMGVAPPN